MNVVDSSAWLEYFADGANAAVFAKPIEATRSLVVPSLSLYEVFKRVAQQRGEDEALRAIAVMEQGTVVDLDRATALEAGGCTSFDPTRARFGRQRDARDRTTTPRAVVDTRLTSTVCRERDTLPNASAELLARMSERSSVTTRSGNLEL
jgi:hypothetical protein